MQQRIKNKQRWLTTFRVKKEETARSANILRILVPSRTINCNSKMDITKSLMNWPILNMLEPEFISNIRMVVVHGSSGKEALMVTHDGMVYALGRNLNGCSGTGDTHGSLTPIMVNELCKKDIKTFAHGSSSYVLALTQSGQVYSWGDNSEGQLGNASNINYSNPTPTLVGGILAGKLIVAIACGKFHSLLLSASGEVYQMGQKIYCVNNVGLKEVKSLGSKEVKSLGGKKIVYISCGDWYSIAVTADGEVYGWGNNSLGQLGIGNYNSQERPCKVTGLTGIVIEKVVCGYAHTLALSNKGILYAWGANSYGQVGHNCSNDTKVCSPVQLKIPLLGVSKVLDVAATHYNHISVAMGEGNRVFIWGHCLRQCIQIPMLTPHTCLYDAFACYATPNVMHKPLKLYHTESGILKVCMNEAFNDPDTSDLTIQVEGKPIYVHKAILRMRCQYFRTMFQEHWAENNQSVIEHKQFSYNVYRAFLEYLYTDKINVLIKDAEDFLDLTNAYGESKLRHQWIQLIKKDVTVSNVILLYNAAIQFNAEDLEVYCFQYALHHMTAVVQTPDFSELDAFTMKSFIIKAAKEGAFKT